MKNTGYVIDEFILDRFELPICEDVEDDYYTLEEIRQEVNKRITELSKLGHSFSLSHEQVAKYEFLDTSETIAGTWPVADHKYKFEISKQAARKRNEKYLDNIIFHELCHMLQFEFLFSSFAIYYEEGKLKGNIDKARLGVLLSANEGHTELWYTFVNKVNRAFVIIPPVNKTLSDKDVTDIFLESTFNSEHDYEIKPWQPDIFDLTAPEFSIQEKIYV